MSGMLPSAAKPPSCLCRLLLVCWNYRNQFIQCHTQLWTFFLTCHHVVQNFLHRNLPTKPISTRIGSNVVPPGQL